jgi:hypothetical protein
MAEVTLRIETPDGGAEQAAVLAILLRDQIKALPIESVQTPKNIVAPEGARSGDIFSWSTLIVTLAPAGIKELLQLVQACVTRQKAPAKIAVKYEGAELIIEGNPDPQQIQAAKDFLGLINSKDAP